MNLHLCWESELVLIKAPDRKSLIGRILRLAESHWLMERFRLVDVAYSLAVSSSEIRQGTVLALVVSSMEDLAEKCRKAAGKLADPACRQIRNRRGIYFFENPLGQEGSVAFLFPGEGSQYRGMLGDLCLHFPEIRRWYDTMDAAFHDHPRGYVLSEALFPNRSGEDESVLWSMDMGAEAVFAANQGLFEVLDSLDLRPQAMVGHSTGEYSSVLASGMIDLRTRSELTGFVRSVNGVYEKLVGEGRIIKGALYAVGAPWDGLKVGLVPELDRAVCLAMINCPHQTVLYVSQREASRLEDFLKKKNVVFERLPFDRAYHTPFFRPMAEALKDLLQSIPVKSPSVSVYSCMTAEPFPKDPEMVRQLVARQWCRPVRFMETIQRMYQDGIRIFVEVGPRGNLTAFVKDILRSEIHVAVPVNLARVPGLRQLNTALAILAAHQVPFQAENLFRHRNPRRVPIWGEDTDRAAASGPSPTEREISLLLPRCHVKERVLARSSFRGHPEDRQEAGATSSKLRKGEPPSGDPGKDVEAPSVGDGVLQRYFDNMELFLETQERVFDAFLRAAQRCDDGGQHGDTLGGNTTTGENGVRYPFLREILDLVPGKRLTAKCTITLDEDLFLEDHTLGGRVSEVDADMRSLAVIPLTFSMEILAQAASFVADGAPVLEMREIRASKWIALDTGRVELKIEARKKGGSRDNAVHVRLFDVALEDQGKAVTFPIMEGTVIVGPGRPGSETPLRLPKQGWRASSWRSRDLYDGFMFHGPRLQAVSAVEDSHERAVVATLCSLPSTGFFRSISEVHWLSEPVVLDAAGQVIAYWTSDRLKDSYHIFPFRVERVLFHDVPLPLGMSFRCHAVIDRIDEDIMRSHMDIVDQRGRVRIAVRGWWDRRFPVPSRFERFKNQPCQFDLSEPIHDELLGQRSKGVEIRFLTGINPRFWTSYDKIWQRLLAHVALGKSERDFFLGWNARSKRKLSWLLGRVAVKEAVRALARRHGHGVLCLADISIPKREDGPPKLQSIKGRTPDFDLLLSLAHTNGNAVAVAADPHVFDCVGVDLEPRRPLKGKIETLALAPQERDFLQELKNSTDYDQWLLRLWCAKEAAAKAVGSGFQGRPDAFVTYPEDLERGTLRVEAQLLRVGESVGSLGDSRDGKTLAVVTGMIADYMIAFAFKPRSSKKS